jgi:peptidyl-tRNA hydrolase, PTH1 family
MLLLVGLGNPGARYANTRHNVGFLAVEAIARRYNIATWRPHFDGITCEGSIAGDHVLLLLPRTFMNESGRSVAQAAKYRGLQVEDITVFHDDIERRPGNVKVKIGGGDRGHNGLRSITAHLGKEYRRVQIGVGRPEHKHLVESYVLSKFEDEESTWFNRLADVIAEKVTFLLRGDNALFEHEVAFAAGPL